MMIVSVLVVEKMKLSLQALVIHKIILWKTKMSREKVMIQPEASKNRIRTYRVSAPIIMTNLASENALGNDAFIVIELYLKMR